MKKKKKFYNIISSSLRNLPNSPNSLNLKGTETTSRGDCEEIKDFVYLKKYNVKTDGEAFRRIKIPVVHSFNDIIVAWKIISNWHDGTNGTWTLKEDPLLKYEINCTFETKLFRGMNFEVHLYLLKFPD